MFIVYPYLLLTNTTSVLSIRSVLQHGPAYSGLVHMLPSQRKTHLLSQNGWRLSLLITFSILPTLEFFGQFLLFHSLQLCLIFYWILVNNFRISLLLGTDLLEDYTSTICSPVITSSNYLFFVKTTLMFLPEVTSGTYVSSFYF